MNAALHAVDPAGPQTCSRLTKARNCSGADKEAGPWEIALFARLLQAPWSRFLCFLIASRHGLSVPDQLLDRRKTVALPPRSNAGNSTAIQPNSARPTTIFTGKRNGQKMQLRIHPAQQRQ